MKFQYRACLLLITLLVLTVQGCGQKGPLYQPDDPERRDNRLTTVSG
ncbi:MAG: lipoprotein [Gammaproteobacteria bacterium]